MIFRQTVLRILRIVASSALIVIMIVILAACGDPRQSPPPIVVTFATAPPTTLAIGASAGLTVTVTNDTQTGNVIWSCSPDQASGACGTFSPTTIHSGVPTNYEAPAQVPAAGKVTVTATSVTDSTKFVSATITISN
ncbi:MAG: hypothetical protein WCA97_08045 [Terriglobales bacterium]|jgi:hypothetical protein